MQNSVPGRRLLYSIRGSGRMRRRIGISNTGHEDLLELFFELITRDLKFKA